MDIIITDMTGHSFTIKLNWDICIMKQDISHYYEQKLMSDYLMRNSISKKELYLNHNIHSKNWMESEDFKRTNDYYCGNIKLICNGEKLEQYHIEIDKFTVEDFKENNNMNFVITKHNPINYECNDDYDSNSD